METHAKSNAEFQTDVNEFRTEVHETLTRHESSINNVTTTMQSVTTTMQVVLSELQALRVNPKAKTPKTKFEPSSSAEPSHRYQLTQTTYPTSNIANDHHHPTMLKLSFPIFKGMDATGWLFKTEQYFEFMSITPPQ